VKPQVKIPANQSDKPLGEPTIGTKTGIHAIDEPADAWNASCLLREYKFATPIRERARLGSGKTGLRAERLPGNARVLSIILQFGQ
jgi:hypothetical protein